ncbi:MAG: S46 family peptidase, partial [Bacteroidales bacterium]|nr:S46 family peptidase [Bacteroidales bacterium]
LRASVEALYYGNQYFLFVFRVYRDVRLVGAPPSSIGKFGGDTDNWMWPRHTGDFSIFRIYADKDNNPADYSADNVPYRPKKSFKISRAGVKEGDFTFVYGCPGSTKEYAMSEDVRYVSEVSDPQKIALRTLRLDNIKRHMDESQTVRIQYSSKAASVSNAWKKWQGEAKGIDKNDVVAVKRDYERRFSAWAKGTRYEGLVEKLGELFARRNPYYLAYEYYTETARTIELLSFASSLRNAYPDADAVHSVTESFFKDYYQPIDEENFVDVMKAFDENMSDDFKPAWFKEKLAELGSIEALRDYVFNGSILTDKAKVLALTADDKDKVAVDPAMEMYDAFYRWYYDELRPVINEVNSEINLAYRDYMQGQMDFEKDKAFYPDANLTLRVAYGHVEGYSPADGIYYYPVSTLKGIIEKDNPEIFDYDIPQTLRDIYAEGGHESQPVCFLATNHTSGGNSGSPVINADGNLIGINFDRVWEGTMSDIVFDPEICRNISLDIRYLLFCIDRIGNASYLFDEMTFVD